MTRPKRTTRIGFTLIEMLIVVSITAIVLAMSFPMIGAMKRDVTATAGVNTVAVAVASARRYASAPHDFLDDLVPDDPADSDTLGSQLGVYSGVAAIFTPAGEIRLARNESSALFLDGVDAKSLERHGPDRSIATGLMVQATGLPKFELNGFADIQIDYTLLGSDAGVAGIFRDTTVAFDDPPILLPPPFALWFNQNGYMVTTGIDQQTNDIREYAYAYYDGDGDGFYQVIGTSGSGQPSDRPAIYNPNLYNPHHGEFDSANWNDAEEKYILPFEKIEAVIGLYIFSQEAFDNAVDNWIDGKTDANIAAPPWIDTASADHTARWEWMKLNGKMLLFSRQTGTVMRNRDD